MNKNMVEMMQKDLHIFPHRDELSSNYIGRLVYSALGYWIRQCIMDRTSESNSIKSKAYILGRGKEVLRGYHLLTKKLRTEFLKWSLIFEIR